MVVADFVILSYFERVDSSSLRIRIAGGQQAIRGCYLPLDIKIGLFNFAGYKVDAEPTG
jgi:hypothetical protein